MARREEDFPLFSLQREMNRLFDDFFRGFDIESVPMMEARLSSFAPDVDVREDDDAFILRAEVPGIDEKDIDVQVTEDAITIKGEKKEEKEDKGKDYYCMERSYGSFQRTVRFPVGVNSEKVDASFKNGILTVKLPKMESAKSKTKKIAIKTE